MLQWGGGLVSYEDTHRGRLITRVARDYPPYDACPLDELLAVRPLLFLLVEQSVISGEYALSTWGSLDRAADYHTSQEYAEDWTIVEAVNLDTGSRYMAASVRITWATEDRGYLVPS